MMIRRATALRLTAGALVLCWLVSLVLPAAIMGDRPENVYPGWSMLSIGWIGVVVLQFGWFANLTLWFGIVLAMIAKPQPGRVVRVLGQIAGALTLLFAADATFWNEMYGDNGSTPVQAFGAGYYLWFVAVLGSAALSFWQVSGKAPSRA